MDHEKLRTASTYLNNLLLARGLLRNGDPIDFVKPSKESRAQIINLVHDLILREDRDREQRELIAATLQDLRAQDARKSHDIERLTAKSDESARATVQAQAGERLALAEVKKVEKAMKALQDQTSKLKTSLAQVKTQCVNDVRKRDLELARLQTHLQGQQRRTKIGLTGPTMTVRQVGDRRPVAPTSTHDLGDPEYSLKQETTEFLTQLSQSLSDENDQLLGLIRNALSTMRDLLGLPAKAGRQADSAIGSLNSEEDVRSHHQPGDNMVHVLPTSLEALSGDMTSTLEHLKGILTSPNFVPVEEVEVREEEIARLREGWERMEQRWRDVVRMMESWRKRMDTGDMINIDDLRRGIGLVSPHRGPTIDDASAGADESLADSAVSEIPLPEADSGDDSSVMMVNEPNPRLLPPPSSPKRKRDVLDPPTSFDLRPSVAAVPRPTTTGRDLNLILDDDDQSEELEVPKMSIEEKLHLAQAEAEEVAAAAAATQSRSRRVDEVDDDTLGKMPSPMAKRSKIRGRARRRKSTLSPEELEALINNVDGA